MSEQNPTPTPPPREKSSTAPIPGITPESSRAPHTPGPLDRLRVLIVDDEPDVRSILEQVLELAGYETVSVTNGLEALERIDRLEPELIVMDVMMPILDGFDTTRAIKKDVRFSGTPVLFLTARKDNQSVRDALLAGGDIFLEKPFSPPDLLQRVEEIIKAHKVAPMARRHSKAEIEALYGANEVITSDGSLSVGAPPAARAAASGPLQPTRLAPAEAAAPSPGAAPARSLTDQLQQAGAAPKLRVLCVDDDQDIVNYVRTLLADDFEVITTTDSETAPDKILAYQPDILLLDIQMPRLNGFHLGLLIRLNRRLRGAQIIYCSSRNDRESLDRAFSLGAASYLEKPFTPEQLRRKLADVQQLPGFSRIRKRLDYREIQRRELGVG